MIILVKNGNMFKSDSQALVNAVNTDGIMGAGLAYTFKRKYPEMFKDYAEVCEKEILTTGKMHIWKELDTYIVNFPTKSTLRRPSKIEYIESGLIALREFIIDEDIKSISIPALGCGLGGLEWNKVKKLIIDSLRDLKEVDIRLYEPLSRKNKIKIKKIFI